MIKPPTSAPPTAPSKPAAEVPDDVALKFIKGAPDASGPKRVKKGKKVQISHTLQESRLNEIDALAASVGGTRAGLINLAIDQLLSRGVTVGGAGEGA